MLVLPPASRSRTYSMPASASAAGRSSSSKLWTEREKSTTAKRSSAPRCSRTYSRGIDGLRHLLALHRAGAVDDEHDVAGDGLVGLDGRREEEAEVAVVAVLAVGQQARVHEALAAGEVEAEVGVGCPAVEPIPSQLEGAVAIALLVELEAGGHGGADLPGHVDVDADLPRRWDAATCATRARSTMASSPSASSGVVTVKLTWRSSPGGTGKARTS